MKLLSLFYFNNTFCILKNDTDKGKNKIDCSSSNKKKDIDDDHKEKSARKSNCKRKKENTDDVDEYKPKRKKKKKENNIPNLRSRTAPTALYSAISIMNAKREKVLIDMGFGGFIGMKIHDIPGCLGYHVISNLDVKKMKLPTTNGAIEVTEQKVHDILGIPFGEKAIDTLEERNADDPFIKEWFQQFPSKAGKNDIRPNDITDVIVGSNDCGKLFRMNFLMLFANTMGMCESQGACSMKILRRINDNIIERVETINWCKFIIDSLEKSVKRWDNKITNHYTGPITFMTVSNHVLFIITYIGYFICINVIFILCSYYILILQDVMFFLFHA